MKDHFKCNNCRADMVWSRVTGLCTDCFDSKFPPEEYCSSDLSDIDTAFPRSNSKTIILTFENKQTFHLLSNSINIKDLDVHIGREFWLGHYMPKRSKVNEKSILISVKFT
jgi:hypothetical protein